MYINNITENSLMDLHESIARSIDRKSSILVTERMNYVTPTLSEDILSNEKIKYLKNLYKKDKNGAGKNPKQLDIRKISIINNMMTDNTYFLVERGYTNKGERVTRNKLVKGSIKTKMYKFNLVPFLYPYLYFLENTEYDKDTFMSQYTSSELYLMSTLIANFISDNISRYELIEMTRLINKDKVFQRFLWKMEKNFNNIKTRNNNIFYEPNPLGLDILKNQVFELKNFYSLLKEVFKNILILPYYNYLKYLLSLSNLAGLQAHIRSINYFKVILEVDDGLEIDKELLICNYVGIVPLIEKIEAGE